ncbi:MAG: hypothetical protein HDR38_05790 [Treponema sp.]|nr:hypothetical protein [Treponema sp.]
MEDQKEKINGPFDKGIISKEEMDTEFKKSPIKRKPYKKWAAITAIIMIIASFVGYFCFFKDFNLENCRTPQNLSLVILAEGKIYYVTQSEWRKMSVSQKKDALKLGLVIMADGKEFMIDPYDYPEGAVDWQEAMRHKEELPNKEQAEVIVKHRFAINDALKYFGLDELDTHYWTSTLAYKSWYNSRAWGFGISTDYLFDDPIEWEHLLRCVSPIPKADY